jgi:hypothetical protein
LLYVSSTEVRHNHMKPGEGLLCIGGLDAKKEEMKQRVGGAHHPRRLMRSVCKLLFFGGDCYFGAVNMESRPLPAAVHDFGHDGWF